MSEARDMLTDTARTVFAEAKTRGFAPIREAGFETLLVAEAEGGFGGDYGDLFAVMRVAGALALSEPVGEAILSARLGTAFDPARHRHLGAFLRVGQSAGALDAALAMSIEHTNGREQFGKPLSKQQAVQQNLAILACEAAAVNVAGQAAARALDYAADSKDALFEIAAAKLRTNKAIGIGTAIAHQAHGAIGFTQDYALHPLTSGLMRWRSEFGNDAYWADILGGLASKHGGAGLWAEVTRRGDLR
jgi:acyl-CoA dehydrogenase